MGLRGGISSIQLYGMYKCINIYIHRLHYITLHCIALHYITLHYTTLHYITLHYITLHCIALHYITLHYTTLHYITLHYITYIHTYIHMMQCECKTFSDPQSRFEFCCWSIIAVSAWAYLFWGKKWEPNILNLQVTCSATRTWDNQGAGARKDTLG